MNTFEAICLAVTWFFILTFGAWSIVEHYASKIEKKIDKFIKLYDMTIIKQIKAEIEGWLKEYAEDSQFELGKRYGYKRLLSFLSTLEEKSEKPIIPNDRDEAAREYAKTTFKKPHSNNPDEEITIVEPDKYAGFIDGAKWQKEQMMNEVVEGTVYGNGVYTWVAGDIPSQFKYGDKVRVIVLPKEGQP